MYHYYGIYCLSFTNHFRNQQQHLMIIFRCMFEYPNRFPGHNSNYVTPYTSFEPPYSGLSICILGS